jgi:SAM-dependent methyltransferase
LAVICKKPFESYPVSNLLHRFVPVIPVNDNCRALNLGYGSGKEALVLAGRGYTVDAVDMQPPSRTLQSFVEERRLPIRFHCCRIEDFLLNAAPGTFDVLVAIYVLHHKDRTGIFLFNSQMPAMMNALRSNGLFICTLMKYRSGVKSKTDSNLAGLTNLWLEKIWRPYLKEVHYEPERLYDAEEDDPSCVSLQCEWDLVARKI